MSLQDRIAQLNKNVESQHNTPKKEVSVSRLDSDRLHIKSNASNNYEGIALTPAQLEEQRLRFELAEFEKQQNEVGKLGKWEVEPKEDNYITGTPRRMSLGSDNEGTGSTTPVRRLSLSFDAQKMAQSPDVGDNKEKPEVKKFTADKLAFLVANQDTNNIPSLQARGGTLTMAQIKSLQGQGDGESVDSLNSSIGYEFDTIIEDEEEEGEEKQTVTQSEENSVSDVGVDGDIEETKETQEISDKDNEEIAGESPKMTIDLDNLPVESKVVDKSLENTEDVEQNNTLEEDKVTEVDTVIENTPVEETCVEEAHVEEVKVTEVQLVVDTVVVAEDISVNDVKESKTKPSTSTSTSTSTSRSADLYKRSRGVVHKESDDDYYITACIFFFLLLIIILSEY